MVREDQVRAARLDVKRGAQVLSRDRRALHVPAGPPLAEPGRPGRSPGRAASQTSASSGSFLPGRPGSPPRSANSSSISPRSSPDTEPNASSAAPREVLVRFQVVQGAPVGEAAREPLDDAEGLDRADQPGGRQHPQGRHVGAVTVDLAVGQLAPVLTIPGRPLQQRVVHVGHVLHVGHVMARVPPGADQQIPGHERGGVPDMGGVVRGDPAGVQRGVRPGRGDRQLAGGGVEHKGIGAVPRQLRNAYATPGVHERRLSRLPGPAGGPAIAARRQARVRQACAGAPR